MVAELLTGYRTNCAAGQRVATELTSISGRLVAYFASSPSPISPNGSWQKNGSPAAAPIREPKYAA